MKPGPDYHPFILALTARNLTVEVHHHSAYQMVLSNDTPFDSTIDGIAHERIHGFLIKPHVAHYCVAGQGTLNVLNIEPYSSIGLELGSRFKGDEHCIVFGSPSETSAFLQTTNESTGIDNLLKALVTSVPAAAYDERVAKIVDYITKNYFQSDISTQTFADLVFLSPSRLASLFKQQTGSSLSKYLLWTRLRQAVYLILSDESRTLTDVAYDSGFYDLPQFNKYMYEMFGMPPKALKQNSELIRIH